MQNITAEIIAIGTEILLGEITDTNSVFIAQRLRDFGVNLYFMTSVGDNTKRIADAVEIAMKRAQIVITCGGLGPTVDDVTREGIAMATQRELAFREDLFQQIADRFASFRVQMTENNRRQAYLPENAIAIDNPVGTAPSFMVEHEQNLVISLPGVPREMKYLLQENVIPYLREKYELGIIVARNLRTAGIGESMLDDLIGNELLGASNPTVGLAAHHGIVDVRITAKAQNAADANAMLDATEAKLRERIDQYIYGVDTAELEPALVDFLHSNHFSLSVVEAGIPNAVIDRLQNLEGGEGILDFAQQFDHPDLLRSEYKIADETDLRSVAIQLAEQICQDNSSDAGVAILVDPDVNDSSDREYVSTVAVYTDSDSASRVYGFGAQFDLAQDWIARWVLARIWRMLGKQLDNGD